MSTINSVGSAASVWADFTSSRAPRGVEVYETADTNGNGAMDSAEWAGISDDAAGQDSASPDNLDSLMPPFSTVEFAQQRTGAPLDQLGTNGGDDDDATALNDLLSQFAAAADAIVSSDGTTDASSSMDASGAAIDPVDNTDGIERLDAVRLDSTPDADPAANQFADLVGSLASALDNSSTGGLSASQANAFKSQFDSAIASLTSPDDSASSSSVGSDAYSSQQPMPDLSALADLVLKQYGQSASAQSPNSSFSALA